MDRHEKYGLARVELTGVFTDGTSQTGDENRAAPGRNESVADLAGRRTGASIRQPIRFSDRQFKIGEVGFVQDTIE